MFSTADYYLGSEIDFRHARTARDWEAVHRAGVRRRRIRNRLRLPKRPHLPTTKPRPGRAVVA
ncbi:MAG: hypothetical protein AVDCRST_MAG72-1358 [uncultured Nocardioidaceae bacterium]|uniref:Uncharacterized protein n=1 Tax=uncultured Nocardioidaceae bacterium TaxID=253824 RepID=A0A6J4M6A1_9ACTN|nr:MAG: hypothetical protein AVDCRST_MAG72-1358 [uncultured Nocardioidaceae bacterium]